MWERGVRENLKSVRAKKHSKVSNGGALSDGPVEVPEELKGGEGDEGGGKKGRTRHYWRKVFHKRRKGKSRKQAKELNAQTTRQGPAHDKTYKTREEKKKRSLKNHFISSGGQSEVRERENKINIYRQTWGRMQNGTPNKVQAEKERACNADGKITYVLRVCRRSSLLRAKHTPAAKESASKLDRVCKSGRKKKKKPNADQNIEKKDLFSTGKA